MTTLDTAALPVCSRCQRKIITFDGSRPTICGNCQPTTPQYGEPTPDPLDEAWREFILTLGRHLRLDRVLAWLGRRLDRHTR